MKIRGVVAVHHGMKCPVLIFTLLVGCAGIDDFAVGQQVDDSEETAVADTTGEVVEVVDSPAEVIVDATLDSTSSDSTSSDSAGSDSAGSDSTSSDSTGSDSTGSDSAGSDSAGSDSAGSDSVGSDSAGSDSAGSDSADSKIDVADGPTCGEIGYVFPLLTYPPPAGSCEVCCLKKCTIAYSSGGKHYYVCCSGCASY